MYLVDTNIFLEGLLGQDIEQLKSNHFCSLLILIRSS